MNENKKFNIDINLAASIQFGSMVTMHWKFESWPQAAQMCTNGFDFIIFKEKEKQYVRDRILEVLYSQVYNKPIQK